jgi:hypothetical protein
MCVVRLHQLSSSYLSVCETRSPEDKPMVGLLLMIRGDANSIGTKVGQQQNASPLLQQSHERCLRARHATVLTLIFRPPPRVLMPIRT